MSVLQKRKQLSWLSRPRQILLRRNKAYREKYGLSHYLNMSWILHLQIQLNNFDISFQPLQPNPMSFWKLHSKYLDCANEYEIHRRYPSLGSVIDAAL